MTDIKVDGNGQAFFDFDALEKITSKEFVKRLQYSIGKAFERNNEYRIRFVDSEFYVRVFFVSKYIANVYKFRKGDLSFEEVFFTDQEAELILTMFADVNLNG